MRQKLSYFLKSLSKRVSGKQFTCPHCQSDQFQTIDRKYLVTELRDCKNCHMFYRIPYFNQDEMTSFYNHDYKSGVTTELPDESELSRMLSDRFVSIHKNIDHHILALEQLGVEAGASILDFGVSWGYSTRQFKDAGYDVTGFEIAQDRAEYARSSLGVDVITDQDCIDKTFDAIFSSHVLEHLDNARETLSWMLSKLNDNGLLYIITPNGCMQRRDASADAWHKSWGLVHPNLLNATFYKTLFEKQHCLVTSNLTQALAEQWSNQSNYIECDLEGSELFLIVRK